MAPQEKNVEKEVITETRKRFFEDNEDILNEFDERDLKRLRNDDIWVRCFSRSRGQDVSKAVEAMNICLKWRNTFGLNDLTERQIDRRLFETGFLFPHNKDKQGNSIIVFTGKLHRKDPQQHTELKRYLVFMLEKHAKMYPSRRIALLFDMQETGLANMDMDFIKFIITCFTNYFPNTLAWLLVVELPWILTAAWKIVKTWLSPEAVNKIKFLSKADLNEYVDQDKILERLGGKDAYQYSYPQSQEDTGLGPPESANNSNQSIVNGDASTDSCLQHPIDEATDGRTVKVTFDEENLASNASANNSSKRNQTYKDEHPLKTTLKPTSESKPMVEEKFPSTKLLTISPTDELVFGGSPNSAGEILQTLTLDNNSTKNVAFKVKTTSPGSYRVRPSAGIISPGSFSDVSVHLQPGHASSVGKDKFLVMSTEVNEDMSSTDIAAVWKTTSKSSIFDHRLRCSIASGIVDESHHADTENTTDSKANEVLSSSLIEQLKSMEQKIDRVEKKTSCIKDWLEMIIKIQIGLLSLMVLLFSIWFYYFMFLI